MFDPAPIAIVVLVVFIGIAAVVHDYFSNVQLFTLGG